jgi:trehalose-phosphatase
LAGRAIALFSDYDGTLTPIVARPELAVITDETLAALDRLARICTVGVISGRDLDDLRSMLPAENLWFAGSHGMDLAAPDGTRHAAAPSSSLSLLAEAADAVEHAVAPVPEAWVERKRFAVAAHFREVDDDEVPVVAAAFARVAARFPGLRTTTGKRILELRPDIDWDKGRALWWLFGQAGLQRGVVVPIYIGDDVTDEDAFSALGGDGLGIVVDDGDRPTAADFRVSDADEVRRLLDELVTWVEPTER